MKRFVDKNGDVVYVGEFKSAYIHKPVRRVVKKSEDVSTNKMNNIRNIVDWLSTHNKNYTKEQYYNILDLQDLLKKRGK